MGTAPSPHGPASPRSSKWYNDQAGSRHAWGDFDNDGYLDLVVSEGNPALRLWRNRDDGNFTAVDAGAMTSESGSFNQSCGMGRL